MDCGLLYSGGPDSTIAALLLEGFYDVTLLTVRFGATDDWQRARESARELGFEFAALDLDESVAREAVDRIVGEGTPREGIQHVHERALDAAGAREFDVVADGTRRDDRVPTVSRAQAQSLERRHGVDYVAPLSGFGRRAVDALVEARLEVETGPSDEVVRADYEAELRHVLAEEYERSMVAEFFPRGETTTVVGLR